MNAYPKRLLCGGCGKVVARLSPPPPALLELVESDDEILRYFQPIYTGTDGRGGPSGKLPSTRPEIGLIQVHDRFDPDPTRSHFTLTLSCHPKRCGRTHEVRDDKVRVAVAHARGRRETLIVGAGTYASANGGPDI